MAQLRGGLEIDININQDNALRQIRFKGGLYFNPRHATPRTTRYLECRGIGSVPHTETGSPLVVNYGSSTGNEFDVNEYDLDVISVAAFMREKEEEDQRCRTGGCRLSS